jgi:uncharacterized coiled-coil protein SlyX
LFSIPKSDVRDRLVSPTPAWISLVLAIVLVAVGGVGAFMFQKVERLEHRVSIQTKSLDGIENDVRAMSSTLSDVEYKVRIMKSDLSDIETSLESLEDSVINLCLLVSLSRGRYIC